MKRENVKGRKPQSLGSRIFDVVNYLILAAVGFIMFYPMFYVLIVSISSAEFINQGAISFFSS